MLVSYGNPGSPSGTTDVFLLANQEGAGAERVLVDVTTESGLAGNGKMDGFAVADYNLDGFSDLYLSRQASDGFFYKARAGTSQGQNNWVGIRLESLHGANNSDGLGATIVVAAGATVQTQVVDGGSGLASQHESDLVFGLGSYAGSVSIQVKWPNGHVQDISGVASGQYVIVADDSPVIDNASIQFSRIFHPSTGLEDWVFSWETFNEGLPELDKVIFDLSGVPVQCWPSVSVLTGNEGDILSILITPEGVKYLHTITHTDVVCTPRCTIPYTIESAVLDCSSTSEARQVKISACTSW